MSGLVERVQREVIERTLLEKSEDERRQAHAEEVPHIRAMAVDPDTANHAELDQARRLADAWMELFRSIRNSKRAQTELEALLWNRGGRPK